MNDPSDNARRLPELAKSLYTERHRKLRELLVEKR
jgi:hypothetical protein